MAWLLPTATAALAVLVLVLALLVRRLGRRLRALEHGSSSEAQDMDSAPKDVSWASLDEERPEFVITPSLGAPMFADLVARETVIAAASLVHGLRRALSAQSRNRIRFQMRLEVKRSRKQRRTELREVRREWAARQREAMIDPVPDAEGSAA